MVTASSNGGGFFKMVPPQGHITDDRFVIDRQPFGVAYRVMEDGRMTELWRTEGWYAFTVFLSNDGHFLIRMGLWAEGKEASKEDLALAFYQDGKLLKEYSTADLIHDKTAVRRSVSHYRWLAPEWLTEVTPGTGAIHDAEAKLDLDYEGKFQLRTIEGTIFRFDSKTGQIVEFKDEPNYPENLGVRRVR